MFLAEPGLHTVPAQESLAGAAFRAVISWVHVFINPVRIIKDRGQDSAKLTRACKLLLGGKIFFWFRSF